ncbi:hypothetical protein A6U86_05420 [Rhizobium sp. AC27/96]|uniref:phage late control D family protein n=1 Tax=Rhizobium sp. AC27/96 TaxID=1841653 RepID=UPI0008287DEF|nr:contractile injection system protein, VgrG/Pvc8 family [Rhizobium sp. AC27/96]OCJ12463.1 hypothetical protein A6U86_05420 [Rhizobium sp. AC27/96]
MTLRQPRAFIIANGETLNCISVDVQMSKTHKSDTFHCEIPFGALPADMDEGWWSEQSDIAVQVQFQTDAISGAVQVFDGKVDKVGHNFDQRILSVQGRDKAAALIDSKSSEKFNNLTPDQIVKQIAGRHGINVDADSLPSKGGKIFQLDYAKLTNDESEWTVITQLADMNGMVAYMTGGILYFKAVDEQLPVLDVVYSPPTAASYASGNFMTLKTSRNVILGRPVNVKVQSWNHKEKKAYEYGASEPTGSGEPLNYNYEVPGLTGDQTQRLAEKRLAENTSHELMFDLTMPGDPTVTPRFDMRLSGTGTAYDQQHDITTIEHSMSQSGGYRMTVSAKSKSKKRK